MICTDVRESLALKPALDDAAIEAHIHGCEACATYRRQHQSLDIVLRTELSWEAPAALTARLLALAADPAGAAELQQPALPAPAGVLRPAPDRPKTWFVFTVYTLTTLVIVLSLLVAWQVISAFTPQIEIGAILTQLLALPGQALAYLNQKLPQSRYAIDFFLRVRVQLIWLLVVAVLWAVLDKTNLQFSFRGRQISL